jgi:hypothetical protein
MPHAIWPPAGEVAELWREYEAQSSREAHLVKDFDKLEMIVQVMGCHMLSRRRPRGSGAVLGSCRADGAAFVEVAHALHQYASAGALLLPAPNSCNLVSQRLCRVCCVQAHEYEQAQGLELQQFFDSTAGKFKTETGWVLPAAGQRASLWL